MYACVYMTGIISGHWWNRHTVSHCLFDKHPTSFGCLSHINASLLLLRNLFNSFASVASRAQATAALDPRTYFHFIVHTHQMVVPMKLFVIRNVIRCRCASSTGHAYASNAAEEGRNYSNDVGAAQQNIDARNKKIQRCQKPRMESFIFFFWRLANACDRFTLTTQHTHSGSQSLRQMG